MGKEGEPIEGPEKDWGNHRRFDALFDELEAVGTRLEEQAMHDSLTGLLTRRAFEEEVERIAASVVIPGNQRTDGVHHLCIAILDIDNFKNINDTYGHPAGDEVIKGVARELQALRKGNVVGRWGGEEFVIAFPGADVGAVLKRFGYDSGKGTPARFTVKVTIHGKDGKEHSLTVTLSGGITEYRPGTATNHVGEKLDATIVRADKALYASKGGGKDRITVFEEKE